MPAVPEFVKALTVTNGLVQSGVTGTLTSTDASVTITPTASTIDLSVVGSIAGVASVNTITGTVTVVSNDSSITVTPNSPSPHDLDLVVATAPELLKKAGAQTLLQIVYDGTSKLSITVQLASHPPQSATLVLDANSTPGGTPSFSFDGNNGSGAVTPNMSINGNAGVSGTFTSADSKTITVTKGLITGIV